MSRVIAEGRPTHGALAPPTDRRAARAARVQSNLTPAAKPTARKPAVSAATVAKAERFLGREALLDRAQHEGIITGGMRAHYGAEFDRDPGRTRAYLESVGLSSSRTPSADAYNDSNLTALERDRIASAREEQAGKPRRIING